MQLILARCALALFILLISISLVNARDKRGPLSDKEAVALVAGDSLSEDVVQEIASRGLAFRPSDRYKSLLTEAGGDTRVMEALRNAHINSGATAVDSDASGQLLLHLSKAGKLMRCKQYEDAGQELTAALQNGGGAETGFVMGGLLYKQEQWPQAASIYAEVLRQDPMFTEAHIKMSYVMFHLGDSDGALREAKLALAQAPNSAEAHRNAGIAFDELQKYNAAEQEYGEALRIKPDYAAVYYDMAIMFYTRKNWDQSIAEYKKSIALDPTDERAHYNLANVYSERGDSDAAIREYREAIRINPRMFWARQNLGNALINRNMNAEAVKEFRELEAMAPDFAMCHECLGTALFRTWDIEGARTEYRKAIQIDPSQPDAYVGLGSILEEAKNYDAALVEYRLAERLEDSYGDAHMRAGRVLLAKKELPAALKELKYAANLDPSSSTTHDLYGQALEASGEISDAIGEFKQAVAIDPKQAPFKLELAAALEKNGDWVGALDLYRQATLTDPSPGVRDKYKTAQGRLNQYLASLRASGKSADAKSLEERIHATKTEPGISEKLDAAMQAGWDAMGATHVDEAEAQYKEAVGLAEKLQPHDERLAASLLRLASVYSLKKDFVRTEATLQRALAADVQIYGAESPMTVEALQALGMYSEFKKDYKSALDFFSRAVDIDEKTFGEASDKVADSLRIEATVYVAQGAYDKAEPILLRAVHINESLFGPNQSSFSSIPLWELCNLYDKWGKPERAEPRYRQILAILEKQYGPDSPILLSTLTGDANALRKLGRTDEAAKVEQRLQTIRAATGQADGEVLPPHP